MADRRQPLVVRFWKKVDRTTTPDGCWPWTGRRDQDGYGTIGDPDRVAKFRRAAQVAWEIEHGESFPEGKIACHTCDNPPCARGSHVFLGSYEDNNRDRDAKHRTYCGERHHSAKLTSQQVRSIRLRASCGEKQTDLAVEFRVSKTHINRIVKKRKWRALSQ